MNNNRLYFPNGFEKTEVRWEKIKIKLAPNKGINEVRSMSISLNPMLSMKRFPVKLCHRIGNFVKPK